MVCVSADLGGHPKGLVGPTGSSVLAIFVFFRNKVPKKINPQNDPPKAPSPLVFSKSLTGTANAVCVSILFFPVRARVVFFFKKAWAVFLKNHWLVFGEVEKYCPGSTLMSLCRAVEGSRTCPQRYTHQAPR